MHLFPGTTVTRANVKECSFTFEKIRTDTYLLAQDRSPVPTRQCTHLRVARVSSQPTSLPATGTCPGTPEKQPHGHSASPRKVTLPQRGWLPPLQLGPVCLIVANTVLLNCTRWCWAGGVFGALAGLNVVASKPTNGSTFAYKKMLQWFGAVRNIAESVCGRRKKGSRRVRWQRSMKKFRLGHAFGEEPTAQSVQCRFQVLLRLGCSHRPLLWRTMR
jgi:hypothetical protein